MGSDVTLLADAGDSIALFDPENNAKVSYDELQVLIARQTENLARFSNQLVLLGAPRTIQAIVDYLALVALGAVVMLVDPNTKQATLEAWVTLYRPAVVLGLGSFSASIRLASRNVEQTLGRSEALLLATSGSTGSPKFVRLTRANIEENAQQIVEALCIRSGDRAFGHLPLFYSFGLSILNSHLLAGATVVLTSRSMLERAFWEQVVASEATSLSGVPYSFQMFERMGFSERALPHLRELTQAGGWMEPERVLRFHDVMTARGGRLWVMYGQTEATARISVLNPSDLPEHAGSVGRSLPRARVWTEDEDVEGVGEIVVSGPQVGLGYADSCDDVSGRDDLGGVLRTGDLGRVSQNGIISIVGRSKRIAKVYGVRVNLDDIERRLAASGRMAALQDGDGISLYVESGPNALEDARAVERKLGLPPRSIRIVRVDRIPTTPAGKVDRTALGGGWAGG